MTEEARRFGAGWVIDRTGGLGLAVSGGSDSMAMLHLLAPALTAAGKGVAVATVNHGLRPEAAAEAEMVARACAALGVPHDTLHWAGWDGQGNLPAAAREARYRLLADWAKARGLDAVALGHTLDDQAETVLMRLARGSGADGLSGMAADRQAHGLHWLRPLLAARRADLRRWLSGQGIPWAEDPTNDDPSYDRVKVRQALPALAQIGLTPEVLADTARKQAMARQALRHLAAEAMTRIGQQTAGCVVLGRQGFTDLPMETQLRLLADAVRWVTSAPFRPRFDSLQQVHAALVTGQTRTLQGALLIGEHDRIVIAREWKAVAGHAAPTSAPWDHRWRLTGPHDPGLQIAALGEMGLRGCATWREAGLPRAALLATPAVWWGDTLVAAPLAGKDQVWQAHVVADFVTFLKCD